MNKPSKHIEGLDGLRALACLAVFGVHFQQISGITGTIGPVDVERLLLNGNTGVALFFALSGFLLSLPFWRGDLSTKQPWLGRYIRSRVFRILPAYCLCLTALVIHQRHWVGNDEILDTLSHYLFLHNYSEEYFYSISSPFWAIAVQVQFYVVLPIVFWLLCRTTSQQAWRVLAILALSVTCYFIHYFVMERGDEIGSRFGITNLVTARSTVFSHSVLAHLPHLLWGVLAAFAYRHLRASRPTLRRTVICEAAVWLSGLLILAILATSLDDRFQVPHGRYNFPYIPALIVTIIACTPFTLGANWLLESFPLRHLGVISYGVYIYHLPCLNLVERTLPRFDYSAQENWPLFLTSGLVLSVVVSAVSYVALERPILQYFRRRQDQ